MQWWETNLWIEGEESKNWEGSPIELHDYEWIYVKSVEQVCPLRPFCVATCSFLISFSLSDFNVWRASDQATLFSASDKSQWNTLFGYSSLCFFFNIIIIYYHSWICSNHFCFAFQALKLQPHGMHQLLIVLHCLVCANYLCAVVSFWNI